MRAHRVVVPTPVLDDHLCLLQCVEDLSFQKLIPKLRVEALARAVLPRTARLDVGCPGSHSRDPLGHSFGDELGPGVGANVPRNTTQDELVRERIDHIDSFRLTRMARHSRVNSSMMLSMRNLRPSWVRSSTKHTTRHGWASPAAAG